MTSNLLMGYPSVQFLASSVDYRSGSYGTADPSRPLANAGMGSRNDLVGTLGTFDPMIIRWDMGASSTFTANYLFVAGANLLKSLGALKCKLFWHDGATGDVIVGTDTQLQTRTFTGPRSEDLMFASGFNDTEGGTIPSPAKRYAELHIGIDNSTPKTWVFRKAYCGLFFDMGHDPIITDFKLTSDVRNQWNREPRMSFTLKWKGVTETIRTSFISSIYRYRDVMGLVLYDTNNYIFNGAKTMHCSLVGATFSNRTHATCDIECNFEELI